MLTDFSLGFYFDQAAIQGRFLRLEESINTILSYHCYPYLVAQLLVEALSIVTVLRTSIKTKSRVTLQIKGKGLIKLLVVDTNDKGDLRGYADYDPVLQKDTSYSFSELMGLLPTSVEKVQPLMIVTVEQGEKSPLFQGLVPFEGNSLAESIRYYFKQSIQQETELVIQTKQEQRRNWRTAVLFLQKNASVDSLEIEQWGYSQLLMKTIKPEELLNTDQSAIALLSRVFQGKAIHFQPPTSIKAACSCSREKLQIMVENFTAQEKEELKQKGSLEIRCEFCNTTYNFT